MLEILRARNVEFDAIDYTKEPPQKVDLERIVDGLSQPPSALVRQSGDLFQELKLINEQYQSKSAVVRLLQAHPQLMQRPIVMRDQTTMIARPPGIVEQLL